MTMTPEQAALIMSKVGAKSGNVRLSDDEVDERLAEGIADGHVTSKSGAYLWFREVNIPCSRPRVLESWDRVIAAAMALLPSEDESDEDAEDVPA